MNLVSPLLAAQEHVHPETLWSHVLLDSESFIENDDDITVAVDSTAIDGNVTTLFFRDGYILARGSKSSFPVQAADATAPSPLA